MSGTTRHIAPHNPSAADDLSIRRPPSVPQAVLASGNHQDDDVTLTDNVASDPMLPHEPAPPAAAASPHNVDKLSAIAIGILMTPLCLSVFLSSPDLTIIIPAIPSIAHSFNSSTGYVWIGSAFILTSTASTPIWGSIAYIWGRKPILLIARGIFMGRSLLCALSPQINALIAGRAVQGLGSAACSSTSSYATLSPCATAACTSLSRLSYGRWEVLLALSLVGSLLRA